MTLPKSSRRGSGEARLLRNENCRIVRPRRLYRKEGQQLIAQELCSAEALPQEAIIIL